MISLFSNEAASHLRVKIVLLFVVLPPALCSPWTTCSKRDAERLTGILEFRNILAIFQVIVHYWCHTNRRNDLIAEESACHSDSLGYIRRSGKSPPYCLVASSCKFDLLFICWHFAKVARYLFGLVGDVSGLFSHLVILSPDCLCILRSYLSSALKWLSLGQGAFYALRPEDLRRRPDVFVGVAAAFCQ